MFKHPIFWCQWMWTFPGAIHLWTHSKQPQCSPIWWISWTSPSVEPHPWSWCREEPQGQRPSREEPDTTAFSILQVNVKDLFPTEIIAKVSTRQWSLKEINLLHPFKQPPSFFFRTSCRARIVDAMMQMTPCWNKTENLTHLIDIVKEKCKVFTKFKMF